MIYSDYQNTKISLLGMGAMRLPLMADGSTVDEAQVEEMVALAMESGVNYFDTAFPYHSGQSERVMGRVLKKYPRESFFLADKFPGHQISTKYDPRGVFEEQLRRCQVEYFDFYLLHNVYENSIKTYNDPQWGIIEYFLEQKRNGRIRHLGFSTHGGLPVMEEFLEKYGSEMEFCQIQLNYLDWTLQNAKEKCALLKKYNIPVWVMEPVRGGKLAALTDENMEKLNAVHSGMSAAEWGFRWLQGIENIGVILSGMSNLAQMKENLATFRERKPLTDAEQAVLMEIAEGMKNSVPCTACRYCTAGCPMHLDIPMLLATYNDIRFMPTFNSSMRIEALTDDKKPSACIACGKCKAICPQKIDIPAELRAFDEKLKTMPSWAEICRQREAAQKK